MNKTLKTAKKLYIAGSIIVLLLVLIALPFTYPRLRGYTVYRVETGSMEPTHPVGSIIYVESVEPSEIFIGDVITFRRGTDSNKVTTHRVVDISEDGKYITKGDNNEDVDLDPVAYERVQGKVILGIEFLGYIAPLFLNTYGRILLGVLVLIAMGLWILGDYLKKSVPKEERSKQRKEAQNGPHFKHDYISVGFVFIGIGLMLFGASKLVSINSDYSKSEKVYSEVTDQFVTTEYEAKPKNWYEYVQVDLDGLMEYNSDIIGWLYFESGEISYPLLYSGDNIKYYRSNIANEHDTAGALFIEGLNKPTLEDSNTFIYGHNMRNLSMFGKLKYYRMDLDYYDTHQYFQIVTKEKVYRYQIFAFEEVKEYSPFFTVYRNPTDEFEKFISDVKEVSYIHPEVPVTRDDKVITMVTCNGTDDERFLVHSVLVETYNRRTGELLH